MIDYRFPFHFEVWFATIAMIVTYGSAIFAVTPNESVRFRYILTAAAGPFLARILWEAFIRWGGKIQGCFRSTASGLKSILGKWDGEDWLFWVKSFGSLMWLWKWEWGSWENVFSICELYGSFSLVCKKQGSDLGQIRVRFIEEICFGYSALSYVILV